MMELDSHDEQAQFWLAAKALLQRVPESLPVHQLQAAVEGRNHEEASDALAGLLLETETSEHVENVFRAVLMDLVARLVERWVSAPTSDSPAAMNVVGAGSDERASLLLHLQLFARLLPRASHLLPLIDQFMSSLLAGPVSPFLPHGGAKFEDQHPHLEIILQCTLIILRHSVRTFGGITLPSAIDQQLPAWSKCLHSPLQTLLIHSSPSIRWAAAQATALLLGLSDDAASGFYTQLALSDIMAQSVCEDVQAPAVLPPPPVEGVAVGYTPLRHRLVNVEAVLLGVRRRAVGLLAGLRPLVRTKSTKSKMRALALEMCREGKPIMVQGPAGSGKSAIIRELARQTGNVDMLEVHLDDQVDSKALLGAYVCADVPGEFKWQPGPLAVAVERGQWVLIEDVDRAPLEVLACLTPLLECGRLPLPGREGVLTAAPGFRLLGTVSSSSSSPIQLAGSDAVTSPWSILRVESIPEEELPLILEGLYGATIPITMREKLLETFLGLHRLLSPDVKGRRRLTQLRDGSGIADVEPAQDVDLHDTPALQSLRGSRPLSLRDLMKLCQRVSDYRRQQCAHAVNFDADVYVTEDERLAVVAHALDVLAAGLAENGMAIAVADHVLAPVWNLRPERIEEACLRHKPCLIREDAVIRLGRAVLPGPRIEEAAFNAGSRKFVPTPHALRTMERVAVCTAESEPVLLVGETGGGKTALVQELASQLGQKLLVQNMSQQTDSSDILGGYRPVDIGLTARKLYAEFLEIFEQLFSRRKNARFLEALASSATGKRWKRLADGFRSALKMARDKLNAPLVANLGGDQEATTAAEADPALAARWANFAVATERFERQAGLPLGGSKSGGGTNTGAGGPAPFAFDFLEGLLVKAVLEGHWVLLDEINLASAETLQRLTPLLEDNTGSLVLTERGDVAPLTRHPNFRLFAAMNPATDAGKKDLPPAVRSRFSEIYVGEATDRADLRMIVERGLGGEGSVDPGDVVDLYLRCRGMSEQGRLIDGAGQKPRYSLRTLTRALSAARTLQVTQGFAQRRSLFESFVLSFETQLSPETRAVLRSEFIKAFVPKATAKELDHPARRPGGKLAADEWVAVGPFWLSAGPLEKNDWATVRKETGLRRFVPTASALSNLRALARAVAAGNGAPVLLQGPTSVGKTTIVEYLAAATGHKCVRINNHEHTDVSEYTGSYAADPTTGRLRFVEGVLVTALRQGHWIILDELNLAPLEVLEGLNRLLDDNKELLIPETQEVVKPHERFRLFATQNPPGAYGGRKPLSRAFRNRFLEIDVGNIPPEEMEQILTERSGLPPSHGKLLVKVMRGLQTKRQRSSVFAGRDGFVTPRDLLRWAARKPSNKQEIAQEGYMLLCERLRRDDEREDVANVLASELGARADPEPMYYNPADPPLPPTVLEAAGLAPTRSLLRLGKLVGRCLDHIEPALLVGETGAGKTAVCELLASALDRPLISVNCHAHTETADLLGSLRPLRGRQMLRADLDAKISEIVALCPPGVFEGFQNGNGGARPPAAFPHRPPEGAEDQWASDLLTRLRAAVTASTASSGSDGGSPSSRKRKRDGGAAVEGSPVLNGAMDADHDIDSGVIDKVEELVRESLIVAKRLRGLFEWVDGPLVTAMKIGAVLLLDEISLAEDAVLERLNSVLEPSRTLVLAEGAGALPADQHEIIAHPDFRVLATMNPGGDYGKRELSPALRSRFTEIWVPPLRDRSDLAAVLAGALGGGMSHLVYPMLDFAEWLRGRMGAGLSAPAISLRDLLTWGRFMQRTVDGGKLQPAAAFLHGAELVFLDGLGIGGAASMKDDVRAEARGMLKVLLGEEGDKAGDEVFGAQRDAIRDEELVFGVGPFVVARGPLPHVDARFVLSAPTTAENVRRVLRALQMPRPVLLEGSPGVGKSSLIDALARAAGHPLTRINLSDQTDLADLLGADLPVGSSPSETETDVSEESDGPEFAWQDGPLLRAIKEGHWVLLDELNLAPQAVLEGLNACLDHRAEVYLPELGRAFKCPPTFRVFAAQNPLGQGGGRKGLPQSFLNRFTKVVVEPLTDADLRLIACSRPSAIAVGLAPHVGQLVAFNTQAHVDTMVEGRYGQKGAPWEFNLRDLARWADLLAAEPGAAPEDVADTVYLQRLRLESDRRLMSCSFRSVVGRPIKVDVAPCITLTPTHLVIGAVSVHRWCSAPSAAQRILKLPPTLRRPLMSVARCVHMGWPVLLVGHAGSGKTTILRSLTCALGAQLDELPLTPGTDVSDLLGCFEQRDVHAELVRAARKALRLMSVAQRGLVAAAKEPAEWVSRVAAMRSAAEGVETALSEAESPTQTEAAVKGLVAMLRTVEDVADAASEIESSLVKANGTSGKGRFVWVDGPLVRAVEEGRWVVLRSANLCPASVLDRLNPLLEPGGALRLSEAGGGENGEGRLLRPHPRFRLFLSVDPAAGEISRAMRNRCVEIALLSDAEDADGPQGVLVTCKTLGHVPAAVGSVMAAAHATAARASAALMRPTLPLSTLTGWAGLVGRLVERGVPTTTAVAEVFLRTYGVSVSQDTLDAVHTAAAEGVVTLPGATAPPRAEIAGLEMVLNDMRTLSTILSLSGTSPDSVDAVISQTCFSFRRDDEGDAVSPRQLALEDRQFVHELPVGIIGADERRVALALAAHTLLRACPAGALQARVGAVLAALSTVNGRPAEHVKAAIDIAMSVIRRCSLVARAVALGDSLQTPLPWPISPAEHDGLIEAMTRGDGGVNQTASDADMERALCAVLAARLRTLNRLPQLVREQSSLDAARTRQCVTWVELAWSVAFTLREQEVWDGPNLGDLVSLLPLLPSVWTSVDAAVVELLQSAADDHSICNGVWWSDVALLLRRRDDLWCALDTVALEGHDHLQMFPWPRFFAAWPRLLKAASHVLQSPRPAATQALNALQHAHAAVERTCGGQGLKDRLWKRGGHPEVPPVASWARALVDAHKEAQRLDAGASALGLPEAWAALHPALVVDESVRREILEALCMMHWAATAEVDGLEGNIEKARGAEQLVEMAQSVTSRIDALVDRLKDDLQRREIDVSATAGDDDDEDDEGGMQVVGGEDNGGPKTVVLAPEAIVRKCASRQLGASIVRPWAAGEEAAIIASLTHAASTLAAGDSESVLTHVGAAVSRVKPVIDDSLAYNALNPCDLRPYQTLVWMWQAHFEKLRGTPSSEALRALSCTLASLLPLMRSSHHARAWRPLTVSWSLAVGEVLPDAPLGAVSQRMEGPVSLLSCPQSRAVWSLLGCGGLRGNATIETGKARTDQMRDALFLLSRVKDENGMNEGMGLKAARDDLCTCLRAFAPSCTAADWSALTQLLQTHPAADMVEAWLTQASTILSRSTDTRVKAALKDLLLPALKYCFYTADDGPETLGMAWLYVGLLRCQLLVPLRPVDPAARPMAKRALAVERLEGLKCEASVRRWSALLDKGVEVGEQRMTEAIEEARGLHSEAEVLAKRAIERPAEPSAFITLRSEMLEAISSLLSINRATSLARSLVAGEGVEKEKAWQAAVGSFVERQRKLWVHFVDITAPFQAAVGTARLGMALLATAAAARGPSPDAVHGGVLVSISAYPFNDGPNTGLGAVLTPKMTSEKRVTTLLAALARAEVCLHTLKGLEERKPWWDAAEGLMSELADVWVRADEKAREERAAKESLFRTKEEKEDDEERKKREEEEELHQFFPHDQTSADGYGVGDKLGSEHGLTDEQVAVIIGCYARLALQKSSQAQLEPLRELGFRLSYGLGSALHTHISPLSSSGVDFALAGSHSLGLALAIVETAGAPAVFAVQQVKLTDGLTDSGLRLPQPWERSDWDFHHDPHPLEARRASEVVDRLLERLKELLEQWPGHALLVQAAIAADRVRKLSVNSPLGMVLASIETTLARCQEWEAFAARHASVSEPMASLTALVIRWRKLELSSWPALLAVQDARSERRAYRYWLHLFRLSRQAREVGAVSDDEEAHVDWLLGELAPVGSHGRRAPLAPPTLTGDVRGLFQTLDQFLRSSPLGEFEARLRMLGAFTAEFEGKGVLGRMLWLLHGYYTQFAPRAVERLHELRRPLEKRLSDEARLCRWDDQTYHALAESATKSHRKLVKILKDYRAALDTPVAPIIEAVMEEAKNVASDRTAAAPKETDQDKKVAVNTMPAPVKVFTEIVKLGDHAPNELDPSTVEMDQADDGAGESQPGVAPPTWLGHPMPSPDAEDLSASATWAAAEGCTHVPRLAKLIERMAKVLTTSVYTAVGAGVSAWRTAEDLSSCVFARMSALRGPGVTKSAKQKAVLDLMRELKRQGCGSSSMAVRALQDPVTMAHAQLDAENLGLTPEANGGWSRSTRYFFRVMAELTGLRADVQKAPHRDVPPAQARAMLRLAEGMQAMAIQQRALITEIAQAAEALKLESAWLRRVDIEHSTHLPPQAPLLHAARSQVANLCAAAESIEQARMVWSRSSAAISDAVLTQPVSKAISDAEAAAGCLRGVACVLKEAVDAGVMNMEDADEVTAAGSAAAEVSAQLRRMHAEVEHVISADVVSQAIGWLAKVEVAADEYQASVAVAGASDEQLPAAMDRVIEACLLAAQGLTAAKTTRTGGDEGGDADEAEGDVEPTFLDGLLQSVGEIRGMLITRVIQTLADLKHAVLSSSSSTVLEGGLPAARALGVLTHQVESCLRRLAAEMVLGSKGLGKLAYVCLRVFRALIAKGLCGDDSDDGDGDGDGDGAGGDGWSFNFEDDVEGTGMGAGEGKQDVSNEIENEEQLLGLQGEQEGMDDGQEKGEKLEGEEKDKGLEMEADFEGKMHDVGDDDQKGQEEEGEDQEEELDREMGETEEADVVDEKMWGSEDENEEEKPQGPEKTEKGSMVKGKTEQDEIGTKEEGEEDEHEAADGREDQKEDETPQGQGEREGEEEGEGQDDEVNQDESEDKPLGVDVRPADESELPEDMELDEDAKEAEEGVDNQPPPGEEEGDDDGGEEMPADDGAMEEEGKEEEEGGEGQEGMAVEPDEAPEEEKQPDGAGGEDDAEVNEEAAQQGPLPQAEASQKAHGLKDASGTEAMSKGAEAKVGKAQKQQAGDADGGLDEEEAVDDAAKEEKDDDEGAGEQAGGGGGQGEADWKHTGQTQAADARKKERKREAPNPFREAGSALDHWHRKLDILRTDPEGRQDDDEQKEDGGEGGEEDGQPEGEQPRDGAEKGTFEYVPQGGEGATEQALGPTMEERELEEKESEAKDGERDMQAEEDEQQQPGAEEEGAAGMDVDEAEDAGAAEQAEKRGDNRGRRRKDAGKTQGSGHGDGPEAEPNAKPDEEEEGVADEAVHEAADELRSVDAVVTTNTAAMKVVSDDEGEHDKPRGDDWDDEDQPPEGIDLRRPANAGEAVTSSKAVALWGKYRAASAGLSQRLCEQLRLVLEPLVASKLAGDYRSGKRINMRRVIPYIASGFRRDKIWLRRTKPAKRNYQVLLAIDDSLSMRHFKAEEVALTALATLATGMSTLEIGELGVAAFGQRLELLHGFGEAFTEEAGARVLSRFTFEQEGTDGAAMLSAVSDALAAAAGGGGGSVGGKGGAMQLVFVVSDGAFERGDKTALKRLIRDMGEKGQLVVLLIVDRSIEDRQEVEYAAGGGIRIARYLDSYPFPYYIVLRDVNVLPEVMADALRQWFELIHRTVAL